MRLFRLGALVRLACTLLCLLVFVPALRAETPKLRIGVINGLTGEGASYGIAIQKALTLANTQGAIKFLFEDDQYKPAESIKAYLRLKDRSALDAIIMGDDLTAQAVAPLATRDGIPLFAWASDESKVAGPLVFRLWGRVEDEALFLAERMKAQGIKSISIFAGLHPYALRLAELLCTQFSSQCVRVEQLAADVVDFRSLMLRSHEKTDAFVLCLMPGQNGIFAKQKVEAHKPQLIWGCNFLENSTDLDLAQGALEGAKFVAPQVSVSFKSDYEQANQGSAHLISAAIHYDLAKLLQRVAEHTRTQPLISELVKLAGAEGVLGAFRPQIQGDTYYFNLGLRVYEIQGKRYR